MHNRAGANMTWGVATALLEQDGREGLFEVDEAWLPRVADQLDPSLIVLGNLFRDQLDRYGEMEALADEWARWSESAPGATRFVLNADDPLVADLGRDGEERPREGVLFFGVEDASQALAELQHAFDAKHCRRCGDPYATSAPTSATWATTRAPTAAPRGRGPDVAATGIELHGMEGSRVEIRTPLGELELELPLPGLYNVYNALAAVAAGLALGVGPARSQPRWARLRAAFGRVETIEVAGKPVSILLIKNPAGANEVLRTLVLEAGERAASTSGSRLNDRIADGRDVSWIWDADFELLAGAVRRVVCAGHAGRRDGAAAEVRGVAGRGDRGRAARSRRRSTRRSPAAPGRAVRPAHLHGAARAARAAGRRGLARSSGDERERRRGDLARRRVRRLRRRPGAVERAGRRAPGGPISTSGAAPAGCAAPGRGAATGWRRSTRRRAGRALRRRGGRACTSRLRRRCASFELGATSA